MFTGCIPVTAAALPILPGDYILTGYDTDEFPFAFDILEHSAGTVRLIAIPKIVEQNLGDITVILYDESIAGFERSVEIDEGEFCIPTDQYCLFNAWYADGFGWTALSCDIIVISNNDSGQNYLTVYIENNDTRYIEEGIVPFFLSTAFTVFFNGNGQTSGTPPPMRTEMLNTIITLPTQGTLLKTDNGFCGWNTATTGTGSNYNAGAPFQITKDLTLYARRAAVEKAHTNTVGNVRGCPNGLVRG